MLTADEKLATASFDNALERTLKEASSVFREWEWSWARRQIVMACIATLRIEIRSAARSIGSAQNAGLALLVSYQNIPVTEAAHSCFTKLDVLSRFALVLRDLEGYSAREAALLLGVDPITLAAAYRRAAETLRSGEEAFHPETMGSPSEHAASVAM